MLGEVQFLGQDEDLCSVGPGDDYHSILIGDDDVVRLTWTPSQVTGTFMPPKR